MLSGVIIKTLFKSGGVSGYTNRVDAFLLAWEGNYFYCYTLS